MHMIILQNRFSRWWASLNFLLKFSSHGRSPFIMISKHFKNYNKSHFLGSVKGNNYNWFLLFLPTCSGTWVPSYWPILFITGPSNSPLGCLLTQFFNRSSCLSPSSSSCQLIYHLPSAEIPMFFLAQFCLQIPSQPPTLLPFHLLAWLVPFLTCSQSKPSSIFHFNFFIKSSSLKGLL